MNITLRDVSKTAFFIHVILSLALWAVVMIGGFTAILSLIDYAKTGDMPNLYITSRFGIGAIVLQSLVIVNMLVATD